MARFLNPQHFAYEHGGMIAESDVERALDAGQVFVAMEHGKWWRLRRNGLTQHWKRDPGRFRIPTKAGLRACGQITERDLIEA